MKETSSRDRDHLTTRAAWATLLVGGLVPLACYLPALHPGLPTGDSGELIAVAATAGIAHPPGYPLYTMLAGMFLKLVPAGSAAVRLNLLSALFGALAAAVLALVVARATRSATAGMVSAWGWAFSAAAFRYALVAEVFTLNSLLAAGVLLALTLAPRVGAMAIALLFALALSHHHSLVLLAGPALAVTLARAWRDVGSNRAGWLAGVAVAAVAGLLPLAWLPLAASHPQALVWGDSSTLRGFLSLLLRAEYGTFRLDAAGIGLSPAAGHVALFVRSLPDGFGWPMLALALIGMPVLAARARAQGVVVLGFFGLQLWFFTRIGFPTDVPLLRGVVERFYILPCLVLAYAAGFGAAWLITRLAGRRALRAGTCAALLALCGFAGPSRSRAHAARVGTFTDSFGRGVLAGLPPRTVLFVRGDMARNALEYLTRVERLRPDVALVDQELMTYPWYMRQVRARWPGLLPPLDRGQRITLSNGARLDGVGIPRADGGMDVLSETGQGTLARGDVIEVLEAPVETLYAKARASFRRGRLLEAGEDRYSGLPGSRNLLWFDHIARQRPAAVLGVKDDSYRLRYELLPAGFASLVLPRGAPPPTGAQLAGALRVAEQTELGLYFEQYDTDSFEEAEKWRIPAMIARTALLLCQPGAAEVVAASPLGHARVLEFAARFEALTPSPDPVCLRAIGLMRYYEPAFRDTARARQDLERALGQMPGGTRDDAARQVLRSLAGVRP